MGLYKKATIGEQAFQMQNRQYVHYYSNTYSYQQVEKKVGESKTEKGDIIKKGI